MKKLGFMLSICIMLLVLSACDGPMMAGTSGSTQSGTQSSTQDGTQSTTPSILLPAPESISLEFQLTSTGDAYAVTGIGNHTEPVVVIPETYRGLPVTQIADEAFSASSSNTKREQCAKITEVRIPASVSVIGLDAFNKCKSLKTVILQPGLTEIAGGAFYFCSALEQIILPVGLKTIGSYAFAGCTALKELTIPEGVTTLGADMLISCRDLEKITVPGSVTQIPDGFAQSCPALHTVALGGNIQTIGDQAFYMCRSLKTIDLGDKLESIGKECFQALESITLPESIKHIDFKAFQGCEFHNIVIPTGIETFGNEVFSKCKFLQYNMSQGGGYLGNGENPYLVLAAVEDSGVTNLVVHEDTQFVLDTLFQDSSITSFTIGKNVKFISPAGIGRHTTSVEIHLSPENENYRIVNNCLIEIGSKTLVRAMEGFVIPDDGSVTVIDYFACSNIKGITDLVIPDAIVLIDHNAFLGCNNLRTIVMSSSVRVLGTDVFFGCSFDTLLYYGGTEEEFQSIEGLYGLLSGNGTLLRMKRFLYSETEPTEPGNYWHYVDGKPTLWP